MKFVIIIYENPKEIIRIDINPYVWYVIPRWIKKEKYTMEGIDVSREEALQHKLVTKQQAAPERYYSTWHYRKRIMIYSLRWLCFDINALLFHLTKWGKAFPKGYKSPSLKE